MEKQDLDTDADADADMDTDTDFCACAVYFIPSQYHMAGTFLLRFIVKVRTSTHQRRSLHDCSEPNGHHF